MLLYIYKCQFVRYFVSKVKVDKTLNNYSYIFMACDKKLHVIVKVNSETM